MTAPEDLDPRQAVHDDAIAAVLRRVSQDARAAAKDGKTPFELLDLPFLGSMARQLGAGLRAPGRTPDGWKGLPPGAWLPRYRAAAMRHLVAASEPKARDDTGESHWAAVAVNAMICAYFERQLTAPPMPVSSAVERIAAAFDIDPENARDFVIRLGEKLAAQQAPLSGSESPEPTRLSERKGDPENG